MHLAPLIKDLSIILALAAFVSVIFKRLHLPVVLGYLLAGFVVGPNSLPFPHINDIPNVKNWAEIGVIILMFSLGLEFSFRRLLRLGLPVVLTGLIEVLGMVYVGYGAGKLIGWTDTYSIFLGTILAISSTTIIAKSFDELGTKNRKFAEFVFGLLIIEDLMAIIFLVLLSTPRPEDGLSVVLILSTLLKMFLVVGAWFVFGYYFLPRLLRQVGKFGNDENLIIFSLGLCFLLAFIATEFQFSSSLGAFIMGSILSESTESHRVEKLIRPIRDLFLAIFFVSVGMLIDPASLVTSWPVVLLLTSLLVLGKLLFVFIGTTLTGQKLRDGVRIGFSMTQIGEFSFIIATLGIQKGSIDSDLLSITVSISMLSTLLTPAMITLGQKLSDKLDHHVPEKIQVFLVNYQKWWGHGVTGKGDKKVYLRALTIWMLNGLVIVTVFALAAQYLMPYLQDMTWTAPYAALVAWGVAFMLSLPFIWGMFWAFSRLEQSEKFDFGYVVLKYSSRLALLFVIGTLSGAFFEAKLAVGIIVLSTVATLIILYRRLEEAYNDFERRFVGTFAKKEQRPFAGFFPWDAHLSRLHVEEESPLVGMTLSEANIRRGTGTSVVNVRRGKRNIVAPLGSLRLFPNDELLVLGTDEQIQKLTALSRPIAIGESELPQDFQIRSVTISPDHIFCGKRIADLHVHENYESILVGVERDGEKYMSPASDFEVLAGDYVWLVGPSQRLNSL